MEALRVGIIGTGAIAQKFVDAATGTCGYTLEWASASRAASAAAFAGKNGIARHTGNADELFSQELDLIYIATPNHLHFEFAKKAMLAGKHVLCEKPLTVSTAEAEQLIEITRQTGCFLAEGLWTRLLPFYDNLRRLLAERRIGDIHAITADYFFTAAFDPSTRLFNPDMGGGALLDIGIYEIVLAGMVLGLDPVSVSSSCHTGPSGVDEITCFTLRYAGGALANCICSITTSAPQKAMIMGTKGRIEIEDFGRAENGRLYVYGENQNSLAAGNKRAGTRMSIPSGGETFELCFPHRINGFEYQLEAVRDAILAGKNECDLLNHADTLKVHRIIDAIRAQWRGGDNE